MGTSDAEDLIAYLDAEVTFFDAPLAIGSYKGEVAAMKLQGAGLGFAGLKLDLLELAEAAVVRGEAGYEVAAEQQNAFLTHTVAGVLDIDGEQEFVIGLELVLVDLKVAIFEGGIAEAIAEFPLERYAGIVVVGAFHRSSGMFARLIVIVHEGVDFLGIGIRKTTAEVGIATEQVGQSVATGVAGEKDVDHGLGQGFDVGNNARTTLVEDKHHGLAGLGQGFHQIALVLAEGEVGKVTGSFAIGVFTDTGYNNIGTGSGSHGFLYLGFVFLPVSALFVIGNALFEDDVVLAILLAKGFVNGIVCTGKLVGYMTLPGIAPTAIEAAHLIGIGAGKKNFLSWSERKDAVGVLQQHHGFFGTLKGCMGKSFGGEFGIVGAEGIGLVEESEAVLEAKDTASGSSALDLLPLIP